MCFYQLFVSFSEDYKRFFTPNFEYFNTNYNNLLGKNTNHTINYTRSFYKNVRNILKHGLLPSRPINRVSKFYNDNPTQLGNRPHRIRGATQAYARNVL